jgi:hypothetical protein
MQTEGWGDYCQDFTLPNCSAGWTCPPNFYCADGGVCMHVEVECNQHSDCPDGSMCTGMGTCVKPRITVMNELGEDTSVRTHTTSCPGEAFSMIGGSHWGYVPDILEAHWMCSYRHWQEYLYTLSQCSCVDHTSTSCLLNATQCQYYMFDRLENNNQWWDANSSTPNRLKMIPTTCDRDYERFKLNGAEMKSCVPGTGQMRLLLTDNSQQAYASRDTMWKPYDETSRRVPLRVMPHKAHASFGFLGFDEDPYIDSCSRFQQCYSDTFTKNGLISMTNESPRRPIRTVPGGATYNPDDIFRCGVIGYFDTNIGMCRIDYKLFPLYYLFCKSENTATLQQCLPAIATSTLMSVCSSVMDPYDQKYSIIHDVNVPALIALFQVFKPPYTLTEHLNTVQCTKHLYDAMSAPPFESKGFYFPLVFTLLEFPFPWFYQCMIGSRLSPVQSLDRVLYQCPSYERKTSIHAISPPLPPNDVFPNYIFTIRGGYYVNIVTASVASQLTRAQTKSDSLRREPATTTGNPGSLAYSQNSAVWRQYLDRKRRHSQTPD